MGSQAPGGRAPEWGRGVARLATPAGVRRPRVRRRLAPAAVPIRVRGRGGPGGTIQDDHRRRVERPPPDAPRARLADRRLALLAGRGRHRGRRDGGPPRPRGPRRDDHGGPELLHLLHPADGDGVHRLVVLVPALRDGRPAGGAPVRLVWPRRRPGDRGRGHGVDPARPDPPRAAPVRSRRARPDGGLPRDPAPHRRRRRRHGGARELLRRPGQHPAADAGERRRDDPERRRELAPHRRPAGRAGARRPRRRDRERDLDHARLPRPPRRVPPGGAARRRQRPPPRRRAPAPRPLRRPLRAQLVPRVPRVRVLHERGRRRARGPPRSPP